MAVIRYRICFDYIHALDARRWCCYLNDGHTPIMIYRDLATLCNKLQSKRRG